MPIVDVNPKDGTDDRFQDKDPTNDLAAEIASQTAVLTNGGLTGVANDPTIVMPKWFYDDGKSQSVKLSTVENFVLNASVGNAKQKAKAKEIAKRLTGNANADPTQVAIAWSNLLKFASVTDTGSVQAILNNTQWKKATLNGTAYETKVSTAYNNTVTSLSTQTEAFTAVNDAIGQWLGRTATAAEKKDFYRKLIAAQKKAPSKVSGTGGSNGRQTTIGGGVNAEKFAQQYVIGKINVANPDLKGQLGDAQDILLSTATKNGIDMSQAASIALVKRIAKGESIETIKNELSLKAQSKYTALADQLKANPGATVYDLSSEFLNEMANTLEIPQAQLKIQDIEPAIAAIDKDGKQRMLATWEWRKQLRNDPRFQYTNKAKGEATDMARSFARSFGVNV